MRDHVPRRSRPWCAAQSDVRRPRSRGRRRDPRRCDGTAPGRRGEGSRASSEKPRRICWPTTFPREHWSKIRSTSRLERVKREIARRSDVVGIYTDEPALARLAPGVLAEINDEWLVQHPYISPATMASSSPSTTTGPAGPSATTSQPGRGPLRTPEFHHPNGLDSEPNPGTNPSASTGAADERFDQGRRHHQTTGPARRTIWLSPPIGL